MAQSIEIKGPFHPDEKVSFLPMKPPPEYNHELYDRMSQKKVVVEIDNGFPGMQVLVIGEINQ